MDMSFVVGPLFHDPTYFWTLPTQTPEKGTLFIRGQILRYGVYSSTARWVLVGSIDHAAQVRVGLKTAI
jgi:hypothetical protein